jgi:hypothetical protein
MYQILEICGLPGIKGCVDSSQKVGARALGPDVLSAGACPAASASKCVQRGFLRHITAPLGAPPRSPLAVQPRITSRVWRSRDAGGCQWWLQEMKYAGHGLVVAETAAIGRRR